MNDLPVREMEDISTSDEREAGLTMVVSRHMAIPLDVYVRTTHKDDDGGGPAEGHRHNVSCSACASTKMSATDVKELINSMCKAKNVKEAEISSCSSDETMDKNACLVCTGCGFMTYSSNHLLNHSYSEHGAVTPTFVRKAIQVSVSARVRLGDALFYCCHINKMLLGKESDSVGQKEAPNFNLVSNWTSRERDLNLNHESGCIKADRFGRVESLGGESASSNLCSKVSENASVTLEIGVDDNLLQGDPKPLFGGMENDFQNYFKKRDSTAKTIEAEGDETKESKIVKKNFPQAIVQQKLSGVTLDGTLQEEILHHLSSSSSSSLSLSPSSSPTSCQGEIDVVHGYKRGYTRERPLLCGDCFLPFYRWIDLHTHTRAHRRELLRKNKFSSRVKTPKRLIPDVYNSDRSGPGIKLSQRKEMEESSPIKTTSSHSPFQLESREKAPEMCETRDRNPPLVPDRTHAGEEPGHTCKKCDINFSDFSSYTAHLKTHQLKPRPYKCKYCAKVFNVHTTFIQHMKSHRGEVMDWLKTSHMHVEKSVAVVKGVTGTKVQKQKLFHCCLCDQRFEMKITYDSHMKRHKGEKPFECKECGKRFFWSGTLDSHMRLHTEESLFWCQFCGRKFPQRAGFMRHLRIHTGEKPFKCDYCNKRFNDISSHKRHVRIHSGERPYQCDECGKTFNHNSLFHRHMRQHKGIKNHKCEVCGKGFIDNRGLKKHQKVHKKEKPK